MYPEGLNKEGTDDELNISFRPSPNYAKLAEAAAGSAVEGTPEAGKEGWMRGVRVRNVSELSAALQEAKSRVGEEGKGMLIEIMM